MSNNNESDHEINPGYVLHQLLRALDRVAHHEDPEVRARAGVKAQRWAEVIEGLQTGTLAVGSRTPVAGTPSWVTLEVVHGGFATGRYLAEGPLDDDERRLLAALPEQVRGDTERERLNSFYLTDLGQQQLREAMAEGRYRIDVPEQGALPVIVWLLDHDAYADALQLVETLRPLMHRLRFYPRLSATPRPAAACVRLTTIAAVVDAIRERKPQRQVAAMNETLTVWNPLYDRLVALWLDTVEGESPNLGGDRSVAGGWPCRRFPEHWAAQRALWLSDYRAAATAHRLCSKHRHRKSNFTRLRAALERCAQDGSALSASEVGWIRRALANTITRHGVPGSEAREDLRRQQALMAARPTHAVIARVVMQRLQGYPADGGLPSLDPIAAEVAEAESADVPVGTAIPAQFVTKAARALEAPIDELVERGVIGSAEVLAVVLPQISAQVAASGIEDHVLRDLYSRTYAAFRRRRSLLLLNLEHQVGFDELPWIGVLQAQRADDSNTRAGARRTLEQVALLALSHFPQTMLPNPLVREMTALSQRAGLEVPLVEEVAADIFMGTFTTKWLWAARVASELLEGSLYARYYDLPPASAYDKRSGGLLSRVSKRWNTNTADAFAELCQRRAQEAGSDGGFVARNGALLEQSQILTTHNLASLCHFLELTSRVRTLAPRLVEHTFGWIARQHSQTPPTYRARLQLVKNTAYAWRQAIFFVSLCDDATQNAAVDALEAHVAKSGAFGERFRPAIAGLRGVLTGDSFDANGRGVRNRSARRLLGWSLGKHWLLPSSPKLD